MSRIRYSSDLTDAEWELFEQTLLLIRRSARGRKPKARREVVNAILYRLRTGCQWRNLPHDFPAWNTVQKIYSRWILNGDWEAIHDALCREVRKKTAATQSQAL